MMTYRGGLGSTVPMFSTCPQCSYLVNGSCLVCEPGNPHPGCADCDEHGLPLKPPWYKGEIALQVAIGVMVTVISTVVAVKIDRKLSKRS